MNEGKTVELFKQVFTLGDIVSSGLACIKVGCKGSVPKFNNTSEVKAFEVVEIGFIAGRRPAFVRVGQEVFLQKFIKFRVHWLACVKVGCKEMRAKVGRSLEC